MSKSGNPCDSLEVLYNIDQALKFSRKKTIPQLKVLEKCVGGLWLKAFPSCITRFSACPPPTWGNYSFADEWQPLLLVPSEGFSFISLILLLLSLILFFCLAPEGWPDMDVIDNPWGQWEALVWLAPEVRSLLRQQCPCRVLLRDDIAASGAEEKNSKREHQFWLTLSLFDWPVSHVPDFLLAKTP